MESITFWNGLRSASAGQFPKATILIRFRAEHIPDVQLANLDPVHRAESGCTVLYLLRVKSAL